MALHDLYDKNGNIKERYWMQLVPFFSGIRKMVQEDTVKRMKIRQDAIHTQIEQQNDIR